MANGNTNNSNSCWCIRISEKGNCKTILRRFLVNKTWQRYKKIVLTCTAHILRKALSIKATAKKLAQNKNPILKKQNHVKKIPSSCLRFRVDTRQLDCSKPRTKKTIIVITLIIINIIKIICF